MDSIPYIIGGVLAVIAVAVLIVACVVVCKRYNGFEISFKIKFFPKDKAE